MASIAIIGQDGAGKSTISKMVIDNLDLKLKYIYMGRNAESGNFNLPTTKLIHLLKIYEYKKKNKIIEFDKAKKLSLHELDKNRKKDIRGPLGAFLRMCNRLLEEWFRLFVSWFYQLRGYIVLYDRHFIFDYAIDPENQNLSNLRLTDKIHIWILNHLYEKPSLVIFLNAPGNVLYARKGEATIEYIEQKNKLFMRIGSKMPNFVSVDASQPIEKVFHDVKDEVLKYFNSYS